MNKMDSHFCNRFYQSKHPLRTLFALIDSKPRHFLAIQLIMASKAMPLYIAPVFLAEVVRLTANSNNLTFFIWICVGYAMLLLVNPPLTVLSDKLISNRTRRMEHRLRSAVVQRLQQLSMGFHNDKQSGSLQSKVLRDVESILNMAKQIFYRGGDALTGLLFSLCVVAFTDWRALIFFLLTAPPAAFIIQKFDHRLRQRNNEHRRQIECMSSRVGEMINLIPVTRAHGAEEHELGILENHFEKVHASGQRLDIINAWFQAFSWVTLQLFGFMLVAISGFLIFRGYMAIDKLILYQGLYYMSITFIAQILSMFPTITQGFEAINSLGEVLESPDLEHNQGRNSLKRVAGKIEFDNITFRYDKSPVPAIENFSLEVDAGECIALVGESGSGKTTLMNLLIGFYRPQQGEIRYDGIPQQSLDLRSWRQHVAVVPQQTILFSGSIRDNIAYGLYGVNDQAIEQAVEAANLSAMVGTLPDGLNTRIGDNGLKLSGGQRQRLAIARAIVRNPQVIILDEATSALDVVSEMEVQTAINNLITDRTTFIVAHRLSTIRHADRIVLMKQGHCIENGKRENLLKNKESKFAELEALQYMSA